MTRTGAARRDASVGRKEMRWGRRVRGVQRSHVIEREAVRIQDGGLLSLILVGEEQGGIQRGVAEIEVRELGLTVLLLNRQGRGEVLVGGERVVSGARGQRVRRQVQRGIGVGGGRLSEEVVVGGECEVVAGLGEVCAEGVGGEVGRVEQRGVNGCEDRVLLKGHVLRIGGQRRRGRMRGGPRT